jgi:hydroxyacylglutathione hydrolase
MELLHRAIGPLATNVYVLADERSREAIAIDTAIPSLAWISDELTARGWRLRFIVSTHGHWDHIGDNAAVQAWSATQGSGGGAADAEPGHIRELPTAAGFADPPVPSAALIAVHPLDAERLRRPQPLFAPFEIPPSVPAVDLVEGGVLRFGSVRLSVLHTPGHTEGSVSLLSDDDGLLLSGDTLFAGGWGRVDLPGGSPPQMVESIRRLRRLPSALRVLPGHGPATTIGREQAWMQLVDEQGRLFA